MDTKHCPHCPTCGQPILPSMGKRATPNKKRNKPIHRIRTNPPENSQALTDPGKDNATLTSRIRTTTLQMDINKTKRGYIAKTIHREKPTSDTENRRYRVRAALITFPNRGTIAGTLTIISLPAQTKKNYDIPEQTSTAPNAPFNHTWEITTTELDTITLTLNHN